MRVSSGWRRRRIQYGAPWRALRHAPDPEMRRKLITGSLVILASLIFSVVLVGLLGAIGGFLLLGIGLLITFPLALLLVTLYQFHLYGQLAVAYGLPGTPE